MGRALQSRPGAIRVPTSAPGVRQQLAVIASAQTPLSPDCCVRGRIPRVRGAVQQLNPCRVPRGPSRRRWRRCSCEGFSRALVYGWPYSSRSPASPAHIAHTRSRPAGTAPRSAIGACSRWRPRCFSPASPICAVAGGTMERDRRTRGSKGSGQSRTSRVPGGRAAYTETVTRKNVAGIDVWFPSGLRFWAVNSASSSFARSFARPSCSAASKAFMVGP